MKTEGREFHSRASRNHPKIEKKTNKVKIGEMLYQILASLIKMLMLLSEEQKQMSDLKCTQQPHIKYIFQLLEAGNECFWRGQYHEQQTS